MNRLVLACVAVLTLVTCAAQAHAFHPFAYRQRVVVRQQVVVQKVVAAPVVQTFYAQPLVTQAIVQPVYAAPVVQQVVAPIYSQQVVTPGCQAFFVR